MPALSLIALCLIGTSSKNLVVFFLVLAVSTNAGTNCGMNLNHIDLSPVYAGTLMGITNSIAAIFAILAPLAVGAIEDITGYKEVRYLTIIYFLFYSELFCSKMKDYGT